MVKIFQNIVNSSPFLAKCCNSNAVIFRSVDGSCAFGLVGNGAPEPVTEDNVAKYLLQLATTIRFLTRLDIFQQQIFLMFQTKNRYAER